MVSAADSTSGHLRIGELSRRTGVSIELLRAWERRYGLLAPARTAGGFRLYGDDDERRVRRMQQLLDTGISAAEAARLAVEEPGRLATSDDGGDARLQRHRAALREALDGFDEQSANEALDRVLAEFTLDTVIRDVVLPYLSELGERWARGEASVAQEHFASALLRGRLLGLARGWGVGVGPLALLACVPGEDHDLGLICFGLALRVRGWRVAYLGADTPPSTLTEAAAQLRPAIVVAAIVAAPLSAAAGRELKTLASAHRLGVAGAGAHEAVARSLGAELLAGDPVTAASHIASGG
jgi:MerR family transcriptional regulator, light-induced transcriptional regulator